MNTVRAYHIARKAEVEAAGSGGTVRELPIGRIEETPKGPRFYFTNRMRSPTEVLDFLRSRPHLGLYNEKGEACDPEAVAQEIRGMELGIFQSGNRAAGFGAPYSDLSEWDR